LDAAPGAAPASFAARLLRGVHALETALLVVAVLALVGLSSAQIVARTLFDGGWAWVDPLTRALVLWTAMLGALVAARDDRHINLDALTRLLRGRTLRVARFATLGFAAVVSAALAWYGWLLVRLDQESATPAFGAVMAWQVELILPVGFGLLALRLLLRAFTRPAGGAP
jgi:TRAP-type C4-dicarboxylate transport system permease small subunit